MVITNEPGYYKEGAFGIRIESALLVVEAEQKEEGKQFLAFERFTQVPITSKLVNYAMLTRKERKWLKSHNTTCLEKLSPLLDGDKRALRWLKRECGATPTLFGKGRMGVGGVEIIWD
ncbi:hypothetical protein FRC03_007953 [Tulasnella sp. 419]|nr:hypothetical protein FRC03_007953 [Tulasnella sp. 419]